MSEEHKLDVKEFLTMVVTNKNMSFSRMTQNFTWAFGIITVIIVVLLRDEHFHQSFYSWLLLNFSVWLWGVFFLRACKEYVNQIRFVALEKNCVSLLLAIPVRGATIEEETLQNRIREYFEDWYSPVRRGKVVWKVLWDHGYLVLISVLVVMLVIVGLNIRFWRSLTCLALVPSIVLTPIFILRSLFFQRYFECRTVDPSIEGLE